MREAHTALPEGRSEVRRTQRLNIAVALHRNPPIFSRLQPTLSKNLSKLECQAPNLSNPSRKTRNQPKTNHLPTKNKSAKTGILVSLNSVKLDIDRKKGPARSRAFAFNRKEEEKGVTDFANQLASCLPSPDLSLVFGRLCTKNTPWGGSHSCNRKPNNTNAATSSPTDAAAPAHAFAERSSATTTTPPESPSPVRNNAAAEPPPSTCLYRKTAPPSSPLSEKSCSASPPTTSTPDAPAFSSTACRSPASTSPNPNPPHASATTKTRPPKL